MLVRLPDEGREVLLRLPGKFDLSTRTVQDLRTAKGVIDVHVETA